MLIGLRKLFDMILGRRQREQTWVEGSTGTPVEDTEDGKLYSTLMKNHRCPDCGGYGFYEGPHGGMSTNIFCQNRECRSGFNITPFGDGIGLAQRIHKGDIERYPDVSTVH